MFSEIVSISLILIVLIFSNSINALENESIESLSDSKKSIEKQRVVIYLNGGNNTADATAAIELAYSPEDDFRLFIARVGGCLREEKNIFFLILLC
jgi:hypothetical protein